MDSNKSSEPKVYLYYGEGKLLSEQEIQLFNKVTENMVITDILGAESEAYLGDFVIPQEGQVVQILKKDSLKRNVRTKVDSLFFRSIKLGIYEGSLKDVKLLMIDEQGNEFLFENKYPIGLIRVTSQAPKKFLYFKTALSNDKNTSIQHSKSVVSDKHF